MADTQEKPKPNYRSKEWMEQIRAKAHAKRAEQKKAKEAEKFIKNTKAKQTIKEAEELVHTQTPKAVIEDSKPMPTTPEKQQNSTNYKQEYYKHKLEILKEKKHTPKVEVDPTPTNDVQPLPHRLLKHEFENDINKSVMRELWKRHFRSDATPYD